MQRALPHAEPSPGEAWKDRAPCEHFIWVPAEAAEIPVDAAPTSAR